MAGNCGGDRGCHQMRTASKTAWKDGTLAGVVLAFIVWVSVVTFLVAGIAENF